MRKKIVSLGIISGIIVAVIAISLQNFDPEPESEPGIQSGKAIDSKSEIKGQKTMESVEADIIMPTKVSRPGCEITDACYVPSIITIHQGEDVTWSNEDVAFHSVTSGSYDLPTEMFDSGHLDPGEKFTFTFDKKGDFDYFCTLHPWMKGIVIVE